MDIAVEENTLKNNKYFCENCKDKNWLIECKCGCRQIKFFRDKWNKIRLFLKGHYLKTIDQKGKNHRNWQGGRTKSNNYWYIYMPDYFHKTSNNYIIEHIYFYEQYHKCCLLKWGEVHHKDENTENNMPWNLEGITSRQHQSIHHTGKRYIIKDHSKTLCILCGSKETYIQKINGRPDWRKYKDGYICRKCYDKTR